MTVADVLEKNGLDRGGDIRFAFDLKSKQTTVYPRKYDASAQPKYLLEMLPVGTILTDGTSRCKIGRKAAKGFALYSVDGSQILTEIFYESELRDILDLQIEEE